MEGFDVVWFEFFLIFVFMIYDIYRCLFKRFGDFKCYIIEIVVIINGM